MAASSPLKFDIDGMDCAACAIKIENALKRLPGISAVSVNYGTRTLSLTAETDLTSTETISTKVKALGYALQLRDPAAQADERKPAVVSEREDRPWWQSAKSRQVFVTGILLALAYAVSLIEPRWSVWAFSAAAIICLIPIVRHAAAGAMSGTPFSIETLMSVAAIGAIAIGEAGEAAVVVFLFTVGEFLEGVAAGRARAGIKALMDVVPRTARRVVGSAVEIVPAAELLEGDIVLVRAGDRIPSDGVVREGSSDVNEAPITGESVPVAKEPGATVYAGSVNANAELRIEITRTSSDNTIARIIHMVEEAQSAKAPTARFIDNFSRWYTPAAMVGAALVIIIPPLLLGAEWTTWIYRGLSILLIACPCALVISTPAAIASGLASGARRGLLIKGGAALETLGKVKTIAFDKTGTLTIGQPRVTDAIAISGDEAELLAKAAAVERGSSHPLGAAIVAQADQRGLEIIKTFGGTIATPGKGVVSRLVTGFVTVGSPSHAAELGLMPDDVQQRIAALEGEGKTVVVVSEGERLLGFIALRDEPREDAAEGLAKLGRLGIRSVMLTGDNQRTANAIASVLGLEAKAALMPSAKLDAIADYRREAPIGMVGDGINDAPALAAASVGIAMGGGTDVALETADVALLRNRVTGVAELVALSRATLVNIWQNIAVALGLKAVFLITTLFGVTPLWMAILADTGATVLVTINALRLLRFKYKE